MDEHFVTKLRNLRNDATALNESLVEDLRPFLHEEDRVTFRRHPLSTSHVDDVNPTTTCTALMSLANNYALDTFYGPDDAASSTLSAFSKVVESKWKSSGLREGNSFTKTMILRTAGILITRGVLENHVLELEHTKRSLRKVLLTLALRVPGSLRINAYDPTATLGYWFIDAIDNSKVNLEQKFWRKFVAWIASDFRRQLSFVEAGKDALMDPVSLGMAAALAKRLTTIFDDTSFPGPREFADELPSQEELEYAVRQLFNYQARSGIWPKYFPLFHYPKAGANFCFSFELLEAVLREFENTSIIREPEVVEGLCKAVMWCQQNRLKYQLGDSLYAGWNSGGELSTLKAGMPESWATGVVHMFLYQLRQNLSSVLENHVLAKYSSHRPLKQSPEKWKSLIDAPVKLPEGTVKILLETRILNRASKLLADAPPSQKLEKARSALLFGPPGTSKTSLVKAIAEYLGWPLIELNPSHFLKDNLENIFLSSVEIFNDVMELSRAVVFLDEMDAVARKREGDIDVTRQLLTTSMLPKISKLYDKGRVLFFMATNHLQDFDDAITRAGRFDLLICVGPPNWNQKLDGLERILKHIEVKKTDLRDAPEIAGLLRAWIDPLPDNPLHQALDLFMFDEFASLLNQIRDGKDLKAALNALGKDRFQALVQKQSEQIRLNKKDREDEKRKTISREFDEDQTRSSIQY